MNVQRTLVGGAGGSEIGSSIREQRTRGQAPVLFKAVVVEVVYDPTSLTDDEKTQIKDQVSNPEFVDIMPPNSVLGRITNTDLSDPKPVVLFPFFSSHLLLPVQAGEQVYVLFEDYSRQGASLGRWIDRVHEGVYVEDPNYTHGDRRFDPGLIPMVSRLSERTQQPSEQELVPGFPNGTGTEGGFTLQQTSPRENPYDVVVRDSNSSKLSVFEPIPRLTKRPNELVLQGTNNTTIVLGQDRTGPALRISGSGQQDQTGYCGTIDICCGRGRDVLPYTQTREPTDQETFPVTIQNSRRNLETDKAPHRRNKRKNRKEGDPNFVKDAARIYVSMNTAGDKNFKTGHSTNAQEGFQYPDNTIHPTQQSNSSGGMGNAYVVQKADKVRIVARKQTSPNIAGNLLLLREGTRDDDLSFVYLEGGKVQVEAKEIFFGKATTKQEPYIKWTVYNNHVNELKRQIKALADQVQEITTRYNQAFINSVAVPFVPVSTLATVGPLVSTSTTTAVTNIKSAVDTINPEDAKSVKMFGE